MCGAWMGRILTMTSMVNEQCTIVRITLCPFHCCCSEVASSTENTVKKHYRINRGCSLTLLYRVSQKRSAELSHLEWHRETPGNSATYLGRCGRTAVVLQVVATFSYHSKYFKLIASTFTFRPPWQRGVNMRNKGTAQSGSSWAILLKDIFLQAGIAHEPAMAMIRLVSSSLRVTASFPNFGRNFISLFIVS